MTLLIFRQLKTHHPIDAASGFSGSVVIEATVDIAVISNTVANSPAKGLGSYVGFMQGAPSISFPLVMKGNANQTTMLSVQNANLTDADITIRFIPEAGSSYVSVANVTDTLKPSAAHVYDLSTLTNFSAVTKWVGSATVTVTDTANDLIVGVGNTVNTKYPDAVGLYTYNAFTGGSNQVVIPLVQENNNGNRTSINCQNIGPNKTTVSVTYTPETGSSPKADESKPDVPQNGMAVFLQNYTGSTKFVGSALVSSSPASPLVCVVNQQKPANGRGSSYEGFNPASATGSVVLPLIQSRNGSAANGWVYTSINVATADGLSHKVTCDFAPAPGFSDPPSVEKTGASLVFLQNDVYGTGAKFIGGATCSVSDGSGAKLFAIVNQTRESTPQPIRDTLATYDGFNIQ